MTTASKITMVRVAMIPVYMILMYCQLYVPALIVFIVASCTDFVDGYIARHYNQVSDFGKFLDPLADKLLVISAMVLFTERGMFPAWALMIVLAREFGVTGLRLVAVGNGRVIAAGWSGKIKTASTMAGLCFLMGILIFPNTLGQSGLLQPTITWVIVATTVISGTEYFIRNWDVLGLSGRKQG